MALSPSELILNPDGSIYHLNLLPGDIAPTIIVVGDPDRVSQVSSKFDVIETRKQKREFQTHTGRLNGKRLTVISTGIGTDNIDIVMNELDALANIDFTTRTIRKELKQLDIIRIGTSGAVQPDIPVDSFVLSEFAIGLDGLKHFYKTEDAMESSMVKAFVAQTGWAGEKALPYAVESDKNMREELMSNRIRLGVTVTNSGFYAPQGRNLRLENSDPDMQAKLKAFNHNGMRITNMEMETSAIYLLAKLLGHRAVSMNCILANRSTGDFSENSKKAVDGLIRYVLEKITS
ncbi:nucleoside phosphorylase [Flavobacteriaceae bacterium TP-CH-4]|uniref:Uridine phosphorylase n=1 Tax=Pelagihabitans pacificus TaxID=2696054 RepID=A0A967AU28_9FLAO|nr:nucleoside phosphorylase [Pelagihabitans pacificus]NHF60024.1 nucleoside phosphorylase [Pelagihabitans pacificus]